MKYCLTLGSTLVLALSACAQPQTREGAGGDQPSAYQLRVRKELEALARETDTTYKRRMLHLIDVSNAIPMDSMAKLYTAASIAPREELWKVRQAIGCEGFRLAKTYGAFPYDRATDRMADSLTRRGLDVNRISSQYLSAPGPSMTISYATCGEAIFRQPNLPDSLSSKPYPARFQPKAP